MKKTDSILPLDNLAESNTMAQIVHAKQDLVRLYPDYFQGIGKF